MGCDQAIVRITGCVAALSKISLVTGLLKFQIEDMAIDDGCGQRAGGEEQDRASVVACRDTPPLLEAGERVLDFVAVAVAVKGRVVPDRVFPACTGGDSRRNPHLDQRAAVPVGIIAPICKQ